MKIRKALAVISTSLAVGLIAASCSGGGSDTALIQDTGTTASADSSPSVWVVIDGETGRQYPLVKQTDGTYRRGEPGDRDASNIDAAAAAEVVMEQYLLAAWVGPYQQKITNRDVIGGWTVMLADGAEARWGPGPTWIDITGKQLNRPAGDFRSVIWGGNPTAATEQQWRAGVDFEYQVVKYYGRFTTEDGGVFPQVFIERSPAGALRGVYIPWAVENGYSAEILDRGRLRVMSVDYGVAQFVPVGDSETQVALMTPDFRENLKGVMFQGSHRLYLNDGSFDANKPRVVKDNEIKTD
jgi:hypothetical protein